MVAIGSFARRDASRLSDLDYIVIRDERSTDEECKRIHEVLKSFLSERRIQLPSVGGAFGETITCQDLTTNIGGQLDTNEALTRRMLLLLESAWLFGEGQLRKCRQSVVRCYVNDHIKDKNIIRFFLNDLIRYHKTMGVDFEFKTTTEGKSWGTRNIKLQFSRKLIYFSGILVVAESKDKSPNEKRSLADRLFAMTPRERIWDVCGEKACDVLSLYDGFLSRMADREARAAADRATIDRRTHEEMFRVAKRDGHQFSQALFDLLYTKYPRSHPIHQALVL